MKAGKITRVLATIFLLLLAIHPATAAQASDFTQWLQDLEAEARRQGIRAETLEAALSDIEPIPRVVELDRQQPEFTLSFAEYRERVVPPSRIERGRKLLARHRQLLAEIGAEFGVQPRYIVALWGIETDFGRLTGGFPVIPALATLAHDGRRSDYFRGELLNALQILDEGHISPAAMTGSWAGAMGQCQFMPSSFLKFSVDYDGDGRRDIWNTRRDVFASAANYLAESGWRDDQTWGRQVRLPADFDRQLAGLETRKLIGQWQELGVRRPDDSELPTRQLPASIIIPDEENQPELAYMVYENFRTTLKWNRSNYFALAVGLLSDAIAER